MNVRLIALLLLMVTLTTSHAAESKTAPPNIILILADDLGWADLSCYGSDLHETPNIDRLATQGLRFTDAYSASPVCSPTRASILTGQSPARLHMTTYFEATQDPPRNRRLLTAKAVGNLPLGEITLAQVLKQSADYSTALVGKWHLGDAAHYPEAHGFDINIGGTFWGAPETYFFPYRGTRTWGDEFRYVPHLEWGKPGEYLTDRLTDEALQVIDRAGDKPFFLYLAHHAPHTPIEAKPELIAHYEKKIQANPKLHHRNAKYAAMVQSLDESVGRILTKLDERHLAQRTLVIFTSDNGGYINEWKKNPVTDNFPLRSGKGSLYEGGTRVPLIVRWPGVTHAGTVSIEPVLSTDLFATLLSAAGVNHKTNHTSEGRSLLPLLKNPATQLSRDALYFHFPHYYQTTGPVSAIRARDWKLLHYYEDNRVELFNLRDDPREQNNLREKFPDKASELNRKLEAWLTESGAQLPTANPDYKPPKPKQN
jgi:arylsulfatase A